MAAAGHRCLWEEEEAAERSRPEEVVARRQMEAEGKHLRPEEVVEELQCPVAVEEERRPREAGVAGEDHHQEEDEDHQLEEEDGGHRREEEEERHRLEGEEEHHHLEEEEAHRPKVVAEEAMAFRPAAAEVEECLPGVIDPREAKCWRR